MQTVATVTEDNCKRRRKSIAGRLRTLVYIALSNENKSETKWSIITWKKGQVL
jgi:hypothetical protein